MYKVEIPADNIQQAAIERRRRLDEDRKKRIFDPKVRVIGVDLPALDDQVDTKERIKSNERTRNLAFDRHAAQTNQLLQMIDAQTEMERRRQLRSLNDFRFNYQQPYQRRDYDLYDPEALKNDFPARIGDEDPRCGVSGMQQFEGEDLEQPIRLRLQKDQMRVWAQEKQHEQELKKLTELEEKKKYEEFEHSVAMKTLELQKATDAARQERQRLDNEYNLHLASWKHHREAQAKHREMEQNFNEIMTNINGEFLTETPDVFNIGGGHKVRVDVFKGITPEQKAHILQTQEHQRMEAELRREQDRRKEYEWSLQEAANNRAAILLEREKGRRARELAIQIRKENQAKAGEDRNRQFYLDHVLYTNPPTEEYFTQFNTTSR
ncbi:RIB43A-domain-containing protein [Polychytrium aggregatum]|uniref:RIB43A-domain-containing protein n=1 Tax=Polychytrium aggregatum TaxID=110093 RepID=UPI0022FEF2E6|nr:RIB43A-domain-containing protein [Polychytrium aggregatum]KAI9206816.1 RIB43A-domain-containing protein [Polychytrium aggregatum]